MDANGPTTTFTITRTKGTPDPYQLSVYDDTGRKLYNCSSTYEHCRADNPITFTARTANNASRTYTAYVAQDAPTTGPPVQDVRSPSSVEVRNLGWTGTVSLRAHPIDNLHMGTDVHADDPATTFTINRTKGIPEPYRLSVYDDTGRKVYSCTPTYEHCRSDDPITFTAHTPNNAERVYTAYVAQDAPNTGRPVNDIRSTSAAKVRNVGWTGSVILDYLGDSRYRVKLSRALGDPYNVSIYDEKGRRFHTCYADYNFCGKTDPYEVAIATSPENPRDLTAYVSQGGAVGGSGEDVRAHSKGLTSQDPPPEEVSETDGGFNPSQPCTQLCHGDPINSATGEFWEDVTDLSVEGVGPSLSWTRSYGATRASIPGSLGWGWTSNLDMRLEIGAGSAEATLENADSVRVLQENGSSIVFRRDSNGHYTSSSQTLATLTTQADGSFLLSRRQTENFRFDASGLLIAVFDRLENQLDVGYNSAGRVGRIGDSKGRFITVRWNGANVASVSDHSGRTVVYAYNANGELTNVTLPDGSTKVYTYDHSHRVLSLTSASGGTTTNVYDGDGRITQQTDPLGRVLTFAYDISPVDEYNETTITDSTGASTVERYSSGRLMSQIRAAKTTEEAVTHYTYDASNNVVSIRDPLDRLTQFTYDRRGNRIMVTDPLGRISTTTYDEFNNPLVATNAAGESTTFTYDERGNLLSMTDPTGTVTTFTVNPDGTVATATDPLGRVTTYAYDARGFIASFTGPDGAVVTTVHDTLGRVTSTTDPRGAAPGADAGDFTSTFTYDAAGRRLTATDPVGAVVASAYDAAGRPTSVTDASGATTTTEYDVAGQVTAVVDAEGQRTTFTYDGAGRVTTVTDPTGATTTTTYDVLGRATKVTDALGRISRNEYDAAGRVTATVSPSGARTTYTYDAGDQLVSVTDALGKVTTTAYDPAGRPVTVTDADGRKVTTSYDRAGRPVKVLRADGSALQWEYDATGKVTATVDASGARTTYTYDTAGRRATATDTAGRTTTFGYDRAGLLTTVTRADGAVTTYAYDAAGRRTGTDYSDTTPDVATVYDVAGRPTSVTDGTGTTTYAYDNLGRVLEVDRGATSVGYAWDVLGRLTELTYPTGNTVQREYDAAGQLTTVTDWANREYTYTYDADGLVEQLAYPNGVTTDYDHDANGQTLVVTTSGNGTDLLELAYGYTDAGLLADQATTRSPHSRAPPTTPATSTTYAWDDLARISEVTGDDAGTFTFDAAGSVTTLADGRAMAYDTARQLTTLVTPAAAAGDAPATTTYTYDGRGNRANAVTDTGAAAGTVAHAYNQANQLASLTAADGITTTYTYAADGLRASATTVANTEQYTWDTLAGVPLLLTDHAHAYIYGNGTTPLAQVDLADASIDYLHTDTLGSVRSTTDATGGVTSDADYDTYGRAQDVTSARSSAVTRFGYAGEYTDPTGYLYLRARYYDPTTAQFLTRDPLEATTGNPYGYTDGNPLQYTDPLGLFWGDVDWDMLWGDLDTAARGANQGIADVVNPSHWADGLQQLPTAIESAYREGGLLLAVNQFNPVFHLLVNTSRGWELGQKGCVYESARAFAHASFDAAGAVSLAAGGTSAVRGPATPKPPVVPPRAASVAFDESALSHIFRTDRGHLAHDTPANRALIQSAVRPGNISTVVNLPDGATITTYLRALPDGTQAWARVHSSRGITNGGLNERILR
ncbi:RHS repeat-associated core domain-containing protein [Cellulomonas shaoxiangyii]|uniref:RHS repeat-associated core domain-containing protein n=1 Tax=Cellulomonas shaoxiangyii TaxID=2566013 RepID=UPI001420A2CB|nr:RHS repeat-associated core domain-containing protein [Cellulomonas shaoxiangyii]